MNSNEELVLMLEMVVVLIVPDSVQATSYVLDSWAIFYRLELHIPTLNFLCTFWNITFFSGGVINVIIFCKSNLI